MRSILMLAVVALSLLSPALVPAQLGDLLSRRAQQGPGTLAFAELGNGLDVEVDGVLEQPRDGAVGADLAGDVPQRGERERTAIR